MNTTLSEGYTVYCDESRHDGSARNPYMAIGGLWVPTALKSSLNKELRGLLEVLRLGSEVKWSKTSRLMLEAYKALVDFFFSHELNFRVIVVDQAKLKYDEFKDGDEELGFYTFYYEMLIKWLNQPVPYNLLLDFKKNRGADHYQVLGNCLKSKIPAGTTIRGMNIIHSAESPLAQLADVLIGAVAASWCGLAPGTPKAELAAYIAQKAGKLSLRQASLSPAFNKLNIFKIELQ